MSKNTNQTAVSSRPIVLSELVRICEDEDVIYAVLQAFLEDAPQTFQNLSQAILAQDCPRIALYSHRMKSSSHTIGAMELSTVSLKMELKAKENRFENMDRDFAEIKRLYDTLKAFVSNENWLGELKKDAGQA